MKLVREAPESALDGERVGGPFDPENFIEIAHHRLLRVSLCRNGRCVTRQWEPRDAITRALWAVPRYLMAAEDCPDVTSHLRRRTCLRDRLQQRQEPYATTRSESDGLSRHHVVNRGQRDWREPEFSEGTGVCVWRSL
jgi:hypothetical protein